MHLYNTAASWFITFDRQTKTKQHEQFTLSYRGYPDHPLAHWIFRLQRRSNNSHPTRHCYYRYSFKSYSGKPINKVISNPLGKNKNHSIKLLH
jgi:hypothetical protein